MFRQAKILYLVAVIGLLVVLALVDLFAPMLHSRSMRQRLRAELLAVHAAVMEQRERLRQEQLHWTRIVADDETLGERLGGDDPDGLRPALATASERATAITGFEPGSVAVMTADGTLLSVLGEIAIPLAPLSPERPTLLVEADHILSVARHPVFGSGGGAGVSIVTVEPLVADQLVGTYPESSHGLGLFVENAADSPGGGGRGHLLSTSFTDPLARRAVDSVIVGLAASGPPDEPGLAIPELIFDDSGERLYVMLIDWIPRDAPVDARPVGVVLLIDGGEQPSDLASFVVQNLTSLRASARLWLVIGLGLLVLAIGIVLFEFEGRRYRRAIDILEYQLAELSQRPEPGIRLEPPASAGDGPARAYSAEQEAAGVFEGEELVRQDRHELWELWRLEKARNGEPAEEDSFEPFRAHLNELEEQLRVQHGCRLVRFEMAVVEGNVVVLATPIL